MENYYKDSFTTRMLTRASMRKKQNDVRGHLKQQPNVLCAIENNSGQQKNDNSNAPYSYKNDPMKIEAEGNNGVSATWLSAIIDDLDAQINLLGVKETKVYSVQPQNNNISPGMTRVKLESPQFHSTKKDASAGGIVTTPKRNICQKPRLKSNKKIEDISSIAHHVDASKKTGDTSSGYQTVNDSDANLPDEVAHFLENALGQEIYDSSITYGNIQASSSPDNASEIMSNDPSIFQRGFSKLVRRHSSPQANNSLISPTSPSMNISISSKFYRPLSQKIKKKLRGLHRDKSSEAEDLLTVPDFLSGPVDKKRATTYEKLMTEVKIQQSIKTQASKALDLCHSSKEFLSSPEEIESHRLLLLADLRKIALLQKLQTLSTSSAVECELERKSIVDFAHVEISQIRLTLRKCLYKQPAPGEIHEWFVIVVSEGINIYGSSAAPCPIRSNTIEFPTFQCTFTNLKPSLEIKVEVYVLKIIKGIVYNHEAKYHINLKHLSYLSSPATLLRKAERPVQQRRHINLSSSFVPCGNLVLRLHDLTLISPWPLSGVPIDSVLLGVIDLTMSCKLNLAISYQGFVNFGSEHHGLVMWNRLWCALKGHIISFWNYPADQEANNDPVMSIDLLHCISTQIGTASRSVCAKPRTVLIETVREKSPTDADSLTMECRPSFTVLRHLMSYDTTREMVDWMTKLNQVISVLREWNIRAPTLPPAPQMVTEL